MDSLLSNELSKLIITSPHAGGSNTTKNGINYEELTDLTTNYKVLIKYKYHNTIQFNGSDILIKVTSQSRFLKCMDEYIDKTIKKGHGCKNPDECYIYNKTIFIIEKKFQQGSGSVCEKIQSPLFKKWQYSRMFPDYNIVYIYCLSEWFVLNCEAELEYLNYINVPYFIGNDIKYKDNIITYILNYVQESQQP